MGTQDLGILRDLQVHLRTANIPLENLSTLAQQGDDSLVEQFLQESIQVKSGGQDAVQSQLYIACFWGVKDVVRQLLEMGADVSAQNAQSLWTPLHAATFQEHGPVVMILLEAGAQPELPDSEGRTPNDFASASDKIWPHFAALGLQRTSRGELVNKGVIRQDAMFSNKQRDRTKYGIQLANYESDSKEADYGSDPYLQAAITGDVLADDNTDYNSKSPNSQPHLNIWK